MVLVFWYALFALFSIAINLSLQWIVLRFYDGFGSLYVAMFFGTLGGLFAKFVLDKKFIFYDTSKGFKSHSKKFFIYSLMGVFTTLLFWGFEISFDYFFDQKFLGATVGLILGYALKFYLDKRFVFV